MRVLICSSTYLPHLNGQAIFTAMLAEGLVARGHQVMMLVPHEPNQPRQEILHGVEVLRVPALHLQWIYPDLNIPFGTPDLMRQIFDRFQPQIIHVQDPTPLSAAVMHRARRLRIPVLATHHTGEEITLPYFKINHPVLHQIVTGIAWKGLLRHLQKADLVAVPSHYSASLLEKHGLHHPIQVIPCGVDLDSFHVAPALDREAVRRSYGLDPDKVLFLYVGRVDAEKRLEVILQALPLVANADLQLAIAGQGNELAFLRQLADQLGVAQQVHFLGQIDRQALPALLHSADIFVMPGEAESFSIATLEAMACGKPILAVNAGALPQLVTHMQNGYLYQAHQPASAALGIATLADDREMRWQMGHSSLERARQYSQVHTIQAYQETYQACTSHKFNAMVETATGKKSWSRSRSVLSRLRAAILLLLFLVSVFFYDQVQAVSNVRLSDLEPLNLEPNQRLLVIAPHPDDELLAAGGLIQHTLETGGQVQVVIVTNGDGQYLAPWVVERKLWPKQADYIRLGRLRQLESLNALETLGVDQEAVDFLGYPDAALMKLWASNWNSSAPLHGFYTRATQSPYDKTYDNSSAYLGADLYNDLLKILLNFHPDVVVLPHPEDTNADHDAVSNFARFALAGYLSAGDYQSPLILTYLVHYEAYPLPRGDNSEKVLLPPAPLAHRGAGWVSYSLSKEERSHKRHALRVYVSQQKMMGEYLRSFGRANEIFFQLPVVDLPFLALEGADTLEDDSGTQIFLPEPVNERFERLILPGADLVGWKAVRAGELLCFTAETRGRISSRLDYRVLAKLPNGETLTAVRQNDLLLLPPHQLGACYNLGDLNYPPVIGFSAESRYGQILDQTAWHFLRILY